MGKKYSEKYYATSGDSQGSNIAPLLFLILVMICQIAFLLSLILFADDFKIFRMVSSKADATALQQDLDLVASWFKNNNSPT